MKSWEAARQAVSECEKMADVSLDEVIRQRGINIKAPAKRPMFGRGAGGVGKSFDARQKIGVNDVRQRLGGGAGFQVKDAREKLGQKDARFKIRGRGGAGGVQDARQMINSRKQGQSPFSVPAQTAQIAGVTHQLQGQTLVPQIQIHANNNLASVNTRQFAPNVQGLGLRGSTTPQLSSNKRMMDARDRLSLKRSIGGTQTQTQAAVAPPLKITKTIQQRPVGMSGGVRAAAQPVSNEHDGIPSKQIKITTANNMLQSRSGAVGSAFSMSAPITKVVKNDAYTAPRPPVPVAPTRPNTSMAATRAPAAALQPVSRTLKQSMAETSTTAPTPPQPAFSPLEGTKITVNNLHPRVTEEDIVELFCVCGALKRARLVKVGVAEVVFVRKEDAVSAYRKYNNRCLDGQPMKCNLHIQGNVITSDQPILLRLSDTPGIGSGTKKEGLPPSLSRPAVLSLQFSSGSVAHHQLYVKEHRVRAERSSHRPLDRTLFVLNIPPYCSQDVVKELFSQFGDVQFVELRDHPGSSQDSGPELSRFFRTPGKQGFKVGYVVFQNSSSVTAAKSHPHNVPLVVCTEQRPVKTGVQKWIQQYSKFFIQPEKLQGIVDSFMEDYDKRKEEDAERQRKEAEQQQEDEEGWVKVTRGHKRTQGRQGPPPQRGSQPEDSTERNQEEEEEGAPELLHLAAQKHTERTVLTPNPEVHCKVQKQD
ncbi:hypothetical protein L3Q82_002844 [Scortum barcoo]|uniref:Uncharacterized protein n=1 Tax=Scortum barcoo TaxID=214431 RepID=A0ACB8VV67_9TELE|nr:hypothetical protein L3Q82_002844 [Scortum barcoo]